MKARFVVVSTAFLLGAITVLQAQDMTTTNSTYNGPGGWWHEPNATDLYRAYELNLEGFGYGTVNEHYLDHFDAHRIHRHVQLGVGAGLEFFLNKYVGIEGEGFSETTHHDFVNDAGGNLVLRYPIGNSGFAPYILGGAGHEFYPTDEAYGDGGAGLEYRFTRWIGIFLDGRFVGTSKTGNYGMGRLGVKFSF
ncbi:MAG TPA: hypothetical protein VME24_00580 [Alphaproteobacteria bacterium]|nr:hypothetical protein [Alphaproteobacteria bacterium]